MNYLKRAVKWFLKTAITVFLVFLVMIFVLSAVISGLSSVQTATPKIENGSFLVLGFPQGLSESPSKSFNIFYFSFSEMNRKQTILPDVLQSIILASEDDRVDGILIDMDNWFISAQHTGEIHAAIDEFKKTGKKVIAFGSSLTRSNYYAALAAERIVIDPSNSVPVYISGYGVSVPYFKKAAEKIGVRVDVIHIGKYKGAGENFASDSMSDEYRESIVKIIDEMTDIFVTEISERREFGKEEILNKINDGELVLITPSQALGMGVIDRTIPYDDLLAEHDLTDKKMIGISDYIHQLKPVTAGPAVAVILAEGAIVDDSAASRMGTEAYITPKSIESAIKKIRKNSDIQAVVLRINSPGGSPLASEKILRKLNKLKEDMPVIVSMGPVAASGGYYIACGSDMIFVEPNTITGSIGVVAMIPNIGGLYEKIGIKSERITTGKYSDLFDLTKTDKSDDIAILRQSMQAVYDEFVIRVSDARDISVSDIEMVAQGQIWTGRQAVENGLADAMGGLAEAVSEAAKLAGIEEYRTQYYPENKSFSEMLLSFGEVQGAFSTVRSYGFFDNELQMLKILSSNAGKPMLLMPLLID